jgi:hypothetical protein
MNERDFDHIFRRKIEQLPNALPDDMIWQQLDNQLNNQATSAAKWWKASALLLLLALLGSNFYLWKKLNAVVDLGTAKAIIQIDTIQKQSIVYQRDTVVKYIYIKEKNIAFSDKNKEQSYFSNNENIAFSDKKINNTTSDKTGNSTKLDNKTSRLTDNTGIKSIANKENISTASKEEVANIEIENKALLSEKTLVNESVKTENEVPKNTVIDSVLISENKVDFLSKKADNQAIVNKEEDEKKLKIPSKIEPVKDRKLSRWTIGINVQSGVLEQKEGHGFLNGTGFSLSTHFSPKWRIRTSFDIQEIEFENRNGKDFYKHKKPITNPDEKIVRWKAQHQPLAQWSLGIERLFNYKKIEAFAGIGTGLTVVFPYEIRYDAIDNNTGKPSNVPYKSETKDAYSTFAGFQANVGISYPIYRKISATLSTHYQYNSNTEKLYWQNQWSGKLGLNYRF